MAKATDVNFDYIPHQRYIVEIKDEQTDRVYYTERICGITQATMLKDGYNNQKNFTAKIHDTKTGEILEGDFTTSG